MFSIIPFMMLDGLLLYAVIAVFLVLELIAMEADRPGTCTGILIVGLLVLQYCSPLQPLTFAYHYPVHALILVAAYFFIGSIWIIIKWLSHVYRVRDRFNAVRQECIGALQLSSESVRAESFNMDGTLTEEGKIRVYRFGANKIGERNLPLQVSQHKAEIYMWWLCWPVSLFWTILNDPITRLWNFVYSLFGNWMQRVSDRSLDLK
jgi:hypothetical protein